MRCDVLDDFFVCRCQLQLISIKASIITPIHKFAIVVASTHFTIEFGTSPHFHPKLSCFFFFQILLYEDIQCEQIVSFVVNKMLCYLSFFFFFYFPTPRYSNVIQMVINDLRLTTFYSIQMVEMFVTNQFSGPKFKSICV